MVLPYTFIHYVRREKDKRIEYFYTLLKRVEGIESNEIV